MRWIRSDSGSLGGTVRRDCFERDFLAFERDSPSSKRVRSWSLETVSAGMFTALQYKS